MNYQLISLDPVTRITHSVGAYPPRWIRRTPDQPLPPVPEGYAYVPIHDRPEYDSTTQTVERTITDKMDGWIVRNLTTEEIEARDPVPSIVSRRQLFLILNARETPIRRGQIKAMLSTEAELIEFEEAQQFERTHPMIANLGAALGMTSSDIDSLFREAAKL